MNNRPPQLAGVLTLVQDLARLIHSDSAADLFGHAFHTLTRAVPFDVGVVVMLEQNLDLYISTRAGAGKQIGDALIDRVREVLKKLILPSSISTMDVVIKDERQDLGGDAQPPGLDHEMHAILTLETRTAGMVMVCRAAPAFTEDDQRIMEIFSSQLSMLLDNLRARQKILSLAETDDLTGVPNRRFFRRQLTVEMERARVYNVPLSLLLIDVDNFKEINDNFGHVMGDVVLSEICGTIRDMLRSPDQISRFGGDEFAVILPHTDVTGAATVADRMLNHVRDMEVMAEDDGAIHCTVSIGIAQYQGSDANFNDLVRRADDRLYEAKRQGKNRYTQ
ncbi:MAG TPA: sensor domain-containing diguanylate cyclase [Thermoanaerobaculia bacterium]|nr:sensor domain-containing diguanylate cyclase [Thermoanaerobaculia bacterium]